MTSVIFSEKRNMPRNVDCGRNDNLRQRFPKYESQVDFWWVAEIFRIINYTSLLRVAVEICAHEFFHNFL